MLTYKNVKFIKLNNGLPLTAPMETMTKGRIYAVIDKNGELKHVVFFDKQNKRNKQIDIGKHSHIINGKLVQNHTHKGYFHDENGTYYMTKGETKLVAKLLTLWYNRS